MIKTQVIGRLGRDCIVNQVNGKNVINFSVAHSERWKDSQGVTMEKTMWVECAYWTERTGIAPYLVKGQQVWVEGTPDVKTFERKDGTVAAVLSLRVREVQLCGSASSGETGAAPAGGESSGASNFSGYKPVEGAVDDLPF